MLVRKIWISLVFTLLMVGLAACGEDGQTPQVSSETLDESYDPQPSAEAALEALLTAEQAKNRDASYALLTPEAREEFTRVQQWQTRRNETGDITGFEILEDQSDGSEVVATVEHTPSLDPFKGLVPARERQTWTAVRFQNGWLLNAEPAVVPDLPNESLAPEAVKAWVEAVQACDRDRARELQALDELYAVGGPTLCGAEGPVTTAEVGELGDGTVSKLITDQYSADAAQWARTVEVTSPQPFSVVVAPFGEQWKVLGILES